MSIGICFSIGRLTVLKVLRTLEAIAGQGVLKIMSWSSCSVFYVSSKSNQELRTWFAEALRVMFANFLMEVLDACRNVGVEVVATVCGMGANSVRPWNSGVFLKRYQSSRSVIKKLQQCLNLKCTQPVHHTWCDECWVRGRCKWRATKCADMLKVY